MYILSEVKEKYDELTAEGKALIEEKRFFLKYAVDQRNIRVINIVISRDEENIKKYENAMNMVLNAKDATREVILLKKLALTQEDYESGLGLSRLTTAGAFQLARIDQGFRGSKADFLSAYGYNENNNSNTE